MKGRNKLTSKNYWESSYENYIYQSDIANGPIENLLNSVIDDYHLAGKEVFEVGCYPGSYLKVFGEHGCILSGVDIVDEVYNMEKYLGKNYKIGKFRQGDILKQTSKNLYDVVCSFGFIEHFYDWEKILGIHIRLLKNGGYLIITIPNFVGIVQRAFHETVDKKNLRAHNLDAMSLGKITAFLESEGLEILKSGPIGNYALWHNNDTPNIIQTWLIKFFYEKLKFLERFGEHRAISPYLGIIARRSNYAK